MTSPIADRGAFAKLEMAAPIAIRPVMLPGQRRVQGQVEMDFCRVGARTVLARAFATSPTRLLAPRNHGDAAWVFIATLGGGLLDGDRVDVRVDVAEGASGLLGTQSSTKIHRSPGGCIQRLEANVASRAALTVVPDPVVCFAGARYTQEIRITVAPEGSLLLLDGYTCGRSARGERWEFDRYASRTTVLRGRARSIVDATRLDPAHGSIAARMAHFDVVLSLLAIGPRFASVRAAMLYLSHHSANSSLVVAASPIADDAVLVRVTADRFENASKVLRPSFAELAHALGDDPFARKW
jgi:urease accessory protein